MPSPYCSCEELFHKGVECGTAFCLCHEDHPTALIGPLKNLIKKGKQ